MTAVEENAIRDAFRMQASFCIASGSPLTGEVCAALAERMDRKTRQWTINAVHLEPGVSANRETQAAVEGAVAALAEFLGAETIDYVKA